MFIFFSAHGSPTNDSQDCPPGPHSPLMCLESDPHLSVPYSPGPPDCYEQPGDLYIGGLLRITKKSPPGVATMCSDVVGDVYRAQYVEAVVLAVDQINRDSWMLPNLTLGFVLADTCGLDLAALAQATHFLPNDGGREMDGGDRKLDRTCASGPPEVPIVGVVGPASSREAVLAASVMSAFQVSIGVYMGG